MVLHKRLSGYAALAILAGLLFSCTPSSFAATSKRYVPASILKGSVLVKGRTFYRTSLSENYLAGVRLGRKASEVLLKWGNPTRITLSGGQASQPAATGAPGGAMMPGMGMGMGMGMGPGAGAGGGMPGIPGPMAGGGAMMPGPMAGGGGMPGMPGPMAGGGAGGPMMGMGMGMGAAGQGAGASSSSTISSNEAVWTYDLPNGITMEFIIAENVVTQITVGGQGPWGLSKTRMGLQLGDTYKLVVWVAGYPESQEYSGRFLRMSYVNRSRVLFTLDKNKVVGVTIALDPNNVR